MAELAPVAGAHHHLAGIGAGKGGGRVRPVPHPLRQIEDRPVRAGVLVELGEAEGAAREARGHRVLDAELRVVVARRAHLVRGRLADGRDGLLRDQGGRLLHLVGAEVVPARDRDGRVRAAVEEMAGGKRLDRDPLQLPGLAEAARRERMVARLVPLPAEVGPVEAETPLVGQARRDEARAREVGGGEPRHRRPAGVEALGPGPLLQELHAPRGGAEGDPLGHDEPPRAEPEEPPRPEGAAERAHEAGRVEALAMEAAPRDRADAGPRLHRDHVGGDHVLPGGAEAFAEREDAGEGARRRMDDARHVGVVVVEAVDEQPVGHRRIAEGEPPGMTDDRRLPVAARAGAGAGERFDAVEGRPGEVEAVRREGDADRVENEMAGPEPDLAGDVLVALPAREPGELGCDRLRNRLEFGSGRRRTAHRVLLLSPRGVWAPPDGSHAPVPIVPRSRSIMRRSSAGTAPRSRIRPAPPCRRPSGGG